MTSVRGIGMSHRGDHDNVEIGSDGNDATEQITYHVICIHQQSISRREKASTANWSRNFFFARGRQ